MKNKNSKKGQKSFLTRWWFWLIIIIVLVITPIIILFTLQVEREPIIEEDVPIQTETSDIDEDELPIQEGVERDYLSWGELNLPPNFPAYTNGDIQSPAEDFTWVGGGAPNLLTVYNTTEEAIEEYIASAVEDDWTVMWERNKDGDEDLSWAIAYETEENTYSILFYWYGDTSDYLTIILKETPKNL